MIQTIKEVKIETFGNAYGAKHLYSLVRKALRGHALDDWLGISVDQVVKNYENFQSDLWKLTDQQIDDDATHQQKRYLEKKKNKEND